MDFMFEQFFALVTYVRLANSGNPKYYIFTNPIRAS